MNQKMVKSNSKGKIKGIIKKYEVLTKSKIKNYNEANTRKDFILPLFKALGWDVFNNFTSNEVVEEETILSGRIDYSFRINNITQFLLEAKSLSVNINKDKWAKQAIEYGWNKGVSWVILTNFKELKVYNSEWKTDKPRPNLTFSYQDYIDKFDRLHLLSRNSFKNNELDNLLSEFGITAKRVNVNDKLAEDLVSWRNILTKNLSRWNENIADDELRESVQRILDRLIFIRVIEDRGIEEKLLWQTYQKWIDNDRKPFNFIKCLVPLFREFDEKYNSNLFQKHLCEDLETEGAPFREIIPQLYSGEEEWIKYRFDAIDADVLGNVYEQYLGTIQQEDGKKSKRKKQGIYYTPSFIVDYIVRKTLGKKLEEAKSLQKKEQIKILDPACGSGSFLIKAFEVLDESLRNVRGHQATELEKSSLRKYRILRENLYGVDLDEQAIEIARLNLMLKALVADYKLPLLTDHMKVGNSLISDEKISNKPFRWREEFTEVFKNENSGFDVIIGNPPYVRVDELNKVDKKYWKEKFLTSWGKYDLYYLFIEKSINILNSKGVLGFIVPNKFCVATSAKKLRKLLINNSCELNIISVSRHNIFEDASNYPVILIFKKGKSFQKVKTTYLKENEDLSLKDEISYEISKESLEKLPDNIFPINVNQEGLDLTIKLLKLGNKLGNYVEISEGLRIPKKFEKENYLSGSHEIVKQYQFDKYSLVEKGNYIKNKNYLKVCSPNTKRYNNIKKQKIVIAEDALKLSATLDLNKRIPQGGVYFLTTKENINLHFILGLLNSKLFTFIYNTLYGGMHMGGGYLRYRSSFLKNLPILIPEEKEIRSVTSKVREIYDFQRDFKERYQYSDKSNKLKADLDAIKGEIDQLVYKLYNLTSKEIEIIENYHN